MVKRALITAMAALALSGCAGYITAIPKYDIQSDRGDVIDEQGAWTIRDRPFDNVLMIRPTFGRAAGKAFADGATLWLTDINGSDYYAHAVATWFAKQSRPCQTIDRRRIGPTHWEFNYRCEAPAA